MERASSDRLPDATGSEAEELGPRGCPVLSEIGLLQPCRDAGEFRLDSDLRSDGAQIGGRSIAAHGIHSLQLGRSGLQLVTLIDRHRSGRSRAYLGVAMILSASIRPSMRQSKTSFPCRSRSPDWLDRLIGDRCRAGR